MSLLERASSLFSTVEAAAGGAAPLHWYESTYAIVGFGVAAAVVVLYLVPLAWQYLTAPAHLTEVDGKHAFITGGSSGIGKALAIEFARRGANVTIAARNKAKLAKAKAEIEAAASEARKGRAEGNGKGKEASFCLTVSMDTTDVAAVAAAVDKAEATFGGVGREVERKREERRGKKEGLD